MILIFGSPDLRAMKSEEMNHLQTSTKPKKKVGMILFDRIILAIENKTIFIQGLFLHRNNECYTKQLRTSCIKSLNEYLR